MGKQTPNGIHKIHYLIFLRVLIKSGVLILSHNNFIR